MSSSNAQYTALASASAAFDSLRQKHLVQLRPLNDFFDKNRFSRPTNAAQISSRLKYAFLLSSSLILCSFSVRSLFVLCLFRLSHSCCLFLLVATTSNTLEQTISSLSPSS